ncbi:FAD-dependent monooxygenase [Nocardia sp. NPDC020380]|uniref:FAD-dependent monooxygenase n=1 Tax=Nocardia sp. NPDC020380 TaxID=3364309 RepID=UPI0037AEB2E3
MDYDVIIVGSGPVGLMLACELRLGGVRPLLIERLAEPAGHDRAGALHVRSVELLDMRGLLERFLEGNDIVHGLPFAGMFRRGLDFRLLPTRRPFSLLVPQSRIEELLTARARELDVEIRREHEVVGLTQQADNVELTVRTPAGERLLRAAYVAGCDGGRSTVRRLANIPFAGTDGHVQALIGYVTTPEHDVPRRWERTERGLLVLSFPPEGGIGRVVTVEYDRPRPDREKPVTLDELAAAVTRVRGAELTLTEPVLWMSRFTDVSRQAEQYRTGRVLLAGDAAHVHFPIGGQGCNTGLHDAVNLGWKLAARIHGWGSPELLDTYHAERHPAAARVLANTRAQLALMNPDNDHTSPLRDLVEDLLAYPEANRHFAAMISGSDVRYLPPEQSGASAHPLLGRFAGHLSVRLTPLTDLLHDARGVFIDVLGRPELRTAAESWKDRVDYVIGSVDRPIDVDGLLIRPDGYTAWVVPNGGDAHDLRSALRRWFGPPLTN